MELVEMSYSLISSWMLICNALSRLVYYIPRRGEKRLVRKYPQIYQTVLG